MTLPTTQHNYTPPPSLLDDATQDLLTLPSHVLTKIIDNLPPRCLAILRTVCKSLDSLIKDADSTWQRHFARCWGVSSSSSPQRALATKMITSNHWRCAKTRMDMLYGHRGRVRSVCLVPGVDMLLTGMGCVCVVCVCVRPHQPQSPIGSHDGTVRLWDLTDGTLHSTSRTTTNIRCVAAHDTTVASCAANGHIYIYHNLDITQRPLTLPTLHTGPVSCVTLGTDGLVATGSWDSTVRLWCTNRERDDMCVRTLGCSDWVSQVLLRGTRIHIRANSTIYTADVPTGTLLSTIHAQQPFSAIEATWDNNTLYTAVNDTIHAHDLRSSHQHHVHTGPAAITSLALEYPWLAVGDAHGAVYKIHTCDGVVRSGFWAGGGGVCDVDVCDGWLVAAGQSNNVVRTWQVVGSGR